MMVSEDGNSKCADFMVENDRIDIVLNLMKHEDKETASNALWLVCNFSGGKA